MAIAIAIPIAVGVITLIGGIIGDRKLFRKQTRQTEAKEETAKASDLDAAVKVLEHKHDGLAADVKEVKGDVKTLALGQAEMNGTLRALLAMMGGKSADADAAQSVAESVKR